MAVEKLTDTSVRAKKPGQQRYETRDANVTGLVLLVSPSGIKSWAVIYRHHGLKTRKALGRFTPNQPGHVGVREARDRAKTALGQAAAGIDPQGDRKAATAAGTVGDWLDQYERILRKKHKDKGHSVMQTLRRELHPWRARSMVEITRADVARLIDKVEARAPVMSNRLVSYLNTMFNTAADRGVVPANPVAGMKKRHTEKPRKQLLSDDEIRALWSLKDTDVARALKLTLLLGQRSGEVVQMRYEDIDGDWWTIPAEQRKAPKSKDPGDHEVFLGPMAKRLIGKGKGWIFKSRSGHLRQDSLSQAIKRLGLRWTPHDLRRTMRTRLTDLGVDPVIAELTVGHAPTAVLGQVAATYDHSTRREQKTAAMRAWEKSLRKVVTGLKAVG